MHNFGERLRIARLRAKLTQGELAAGVRVHRVTIARLEGGKDYPGLSLGCRLAQYLKVHVFWLTGLIDNHRQGIQPNTDLEEQNHKAYLAMSADEQVQFAEGMSEFLRVRRIAKQGAAPVLARKGKV